SIVAPLRMLLDILGDAGMGTWVRADRSGKEVLSPAPPPLRTARAPFDASSSSIEQRPCEIRPGPAPPADDTPYETRLPHWSWGQPERYYGRAGYRDVFGGGWSTSKEQYAPAD